MVKTKAADILKSLNMCEYRWLFLFILVSREFYPVGSTKSTKDAANKRQTDGGSDGVDSVPVGKLCICRVFRILGNI